MSAHPAQAVASAGAYPQPMAAALRRESARVVAAAGDIPQGIADSYRRTAEMLDEHAADLISMQKPTPCPGIRKLPQEAKVPADVADKQAADDDAMAADLAERFGCADLADMQAAMATARARADGFGAARGGLAMRCISYRRLRGGWVWQCRHLGAWIRL